MKTIRVTGTGNVRLQADMTRITFDLKGQYKEYDDAVQHSKKDTDGLRSILAELGFKKTDVKTLSFKVDPKYEGYYDDKNHYKQRFDGYEYKHQIKVEFEIDGKRLGQILFAVAKSGLHPEFCISFFVKDAESAKNDLLGKTVKDATEKAKVLAEAAGVTLCGIETIDYSWGKIDFEVHPVGTHYLQKLSLADDNADDFEMDIEPDDIEASDTVTVVWEISD